MSIKQEQVTQIMNMIIKQCIADGELPTEKNVIDRFREYLLTHDPSKPKHSPHYVLRGSNVNYTDVNSTLDNIYDDLSLLYNRCLKLNASLMSTYMLAEKQKTAIDNEFKKLEEEAKSLIILKNSPTYLNCAYDSLVDYSKIDQSKTTAEVNIAKHSASISFNRVINRRINIEPTIRVSYPQYSYPKSVRYEGNMKNMNDDYENTTFRGLIAMNENAGCIMEVTYDYGVKPVTTNQINMHFSTRSKIYARLLYSPDNINIFPVPTAHEFIEINNEPIEVHFDSIECAYIKFILMKDTADSVVTSNDQQDYLFDYTIKQLALFNLQHNDSGIFQSTSLEPVKTIDNFAIGKVSLSVDADVPPHTDVEYYVALEPQANQAIAWNRITPLEVDRPEFPSVIDFMDRTTADNITGGIDSKPAEHELASLNTRGIKMYSIYNTQDIISRIIMYKGLNASLTKTMPVTTASAIPSIDTFRETAYSYYNIGTSRIINSTKPTVTTIVSTSLNFNNTVANNSIKLTPNIPFPTVIYLNGREVQNGLTINSSTNDLPLRVGVNNITVLSYIPANSQYNLDLGVNLITTFGEVLAHDAPMTEVDLFELQNTVMSNDHSKYALYRLGQTTHVVVNDEHPTVKYKLSYAYKDPGNRGKLLFKAILKRQPYSNVTPALYRYAIFCE